MSDESERRKELRERAWVMGVRALLIQALALWEDRHSLERTIPPRRERKQQHRPGRDDD